MATLAKRIRANNDQRIERKAKIMDACDKVADSKRMVALGGVIIAALLIAAPLMREDVGLGMLGLMLVVVALVVRVIGAIQTLQDTIADKRREWGV